jgi:putative acetyltransferase
MKITHRLARLDDADLLFELRRHSITTLTRNAMSMADANNWAATLTLAGMQQKLRELEVWVAEAGGALVAWGALRGDRLEGLYTDPQFASRGIGTELLRWLEALTRERGPAMMHAEASSNALHFYLRRGYKLCGPRTPDGAQPVAKRLHSLGSTVEGRRFRVGKRSYEWPGSCQRRRRVPCAIDHAANALIRLPKGPTHRWLAI